MTCNVGGLDNELMLGQNQGEPLEELHDVWTICPFLVNDVNNTVVGVDGDECL